MLNWAANRNLPYRFGAKKVFILIGDEEVYDDGYNHYSCTNDATITQDAVADILSSKGIQTFPVVSSSYQDIYNEFTNIATVTAGMMLDIGSEDYTVMLSQLAKKYLAVIFSATVCPTIRLI